jgi:hypothetical protein
MIRLKSVHDGFLDLGEVQNPTKEESEILQKGMAVEWPYLDVFKNSLVPGFWYDFQGGVFHPIAGQRPTTMCLGSNSLTQANPTQVIEEKSTKSTPRQRFWRLYLGCLVGSFFLAWVGQSFSAVSFLLMIPFLMLVWITGAALMVCAAFYTLRAILHLISSIINWIKTGNFKFALPF